MPATLEQFIEKLKPTGSYESHLYLSLNVLTQDELYRLFDLLRENSTIKHIKISHSALTSLIVRAFGDVLKTHKTLYSLYLINASFGADDGLLLAEGLRSNVSISYFQYSGDHNEMAASLAVINGLTYNQGIERIDFHCKADDNSVALAFATMLKQHTSFTSIRFNDSFSKQQCNTGLIKLIENVRYQTSLKLLALASCQLDDIAANRLADLISLSSSLIGINCGECGISAKGGKFIANALLTNQTLRDLILGHNRLETAGLLAFSQVLQQNSQLNDLCLSWNRKEDGTITDAKIGRHFAEALKRNRHLTRLGLVGVGINNNGAIAIADALNTNSTLESFNLNCNPITDEGCLAFIKPITNPPALQSLILPSYANRITLTKFIALYQRAETKKIDLMICNKDLSHSIARWRETYTAEEQTFIKSLLTLVLANYTGSSPVGLLPIEMIFSILAYLKPAQLVMFEDHMWRKDKASVQRIYQLTQHLLECAACKSLDYTAPCLTRDKLSVPVATELLTYAWLTQLTAPRKSLFYSSLEKHAQLKPQPCLAASSKTEPLTQNQHLLFNQQQTTQQQTQSKPVKRRHCCIM